MTTITLLTVGAVGFVLGLYVSSQIMEHITCKTNHKKFIRNMDDFDKRKHND